MVVVMVVVVIAAVLLCRQVEAVSFLGGLWIGATLIQLYFHQFHRRARPERAAPPETSPLKDMSYAIRDAPWRPWPQMLTLAVLAMLNVVALV